MEGVLILHQSDTPADDYHTVNTQFQTAFMISSDITCVTTTVAVVTIDQGID